MKPYLGMVVVWLIITSICSISFGLLFLILITPFTLLYFLLIIIKLVIKKNIIREVGIKLSIILTAYLLIGLVHFIRYYDARTNANKAITKINDFKKTYGKYPTQISEIGIEKRKFNRGQLSYTNEGSEYPTLGYPATQLPFDKYYYNFKLSKWEYFAD